MTSAEDVDEYLLHTCGQLHREYGVPVSIIGVLLAVLRELHGIVTSDWTDVAGQAGAAAITLREYSDRLEAFTAAEIVSGIDPVTIKLLRQLDMEE